MTRQPVKALNKSQAAVAVNAAAEKARKAASRKALAERRKLDAIADQAIDEEIEAMKAEPTPVVDHKAQDAANALAAMRVDYDAYEGQLRNSDDTPQTFEQYLREQGFNPDGTILTNPGVARDKAAKYNGPMLALRTAAKSYVKGKNGNPHCNDRLAETLDGLTREQVVAVLIRAMKLESNPYIALNPGQQSMNLRNKVRGQLKNGFIKVEDIVAAIASIKA